jgi:hypothetical protein
MGSINITADENGNFQARLPEQLTDGERVTIRTQLGEVQDSVTMVAPSDFEPVSPVNEPLWILVSGNPLEANLTLLIHEDFPEEERTQGLFEIKDLANWTSYIIGASEWIDMIQTVILPNNMPNVPTRFFKNWSKVKSLSIGYGTTSIGQEAFSNFAECEEIICLALTPPTLVTGANASFKDLGSSGVIKVPAESLSLYTSNSAWSGLGFTIQAI